MCPLNSFALDCVSNTSTASVCQCDQGFSQSNKSDNLTSNSGSRGHFGGGINDLAGENDFRNTSCVGKLEVMLPTKTATCCFQVQYVAYSYWRASYIIQNS